MNYRFLCNIDIENDNFDNIVYYSPKMKIAPLYMFQLYKEKGISCKGRIPTSNMLNLDEVLLISIDFSTDTFVYYITHNYISNVKSLLYNSNYNKHEDYVKFSRNIGSNTFSFKFDLFKDRDWYYLLTNDKTIEIGLIFVVDEILQNFIKFRKNTINVAKKRVV